MPTADPTLAAAGEAGAWYNRVMIGETRARRFVRALHRRVVLLRTLEAAGVGGALASVLALGLGGVLVWRGQNPIWSGAIVLSIGILCGGLWGVLRRPTLLWTAMEADRQLRLQDLLSTACSVRRGEDPWAATVIALAEARVVRLRPREVVLRRLGVRTWGGIAASLLLVASLLTLYTRPELTFASGPASPFVDPADLDALATPLPQTSVPRWLASQTAADRPGHRGATQLDPRYTAPEGGSPSVADPAHPHSPAANANGAGGGEALDDTRPRPAPRAAAVDTPRRAGGTLESDGTGRTAPAFPDAASNTSTLAGAAPAVVAEPWHAAGWDERREAALRSVDAGLIPAAHRDLIRAYFADEPAGAD